jgi:hypothetical protein
MCAKQHVARPLLPAAAFPFSVDEGWGNGIFMVPLAQDFKFQSVCAEMWGGGRGGVVRDMFYATPQSPQRI